MAADRPDQSRLRVLDLFSGLNGWGDPFREAGHEVFAIDNDRRFEADAYLDIGDVAAVLEAVPWRPDILFASPPCNAFSTMVMGRMWTHEGEPKHALAIDGRRLVLASLRIIAVLGPTYWVIENPRARLRTLDLLAGVPKVTVSQCAYGSGRQKMTDLFGVLPPSLTLMPPCRNGDRCHVAAPRGSRTGTQGGLSGVESARFPRALADAFRHALEDAAVSDGTAAMPRGVRDSDDTGPYRQARPDGEEMAAPGLGRQPRWSHGHARQAATAERVAT